VPPMKCFQTIAFNSNLCRYIKDDCIPCILEFLREWFRGADPRLVRRENVREFTRYVFYGGVEGALGGAEEAEIEWWLQAVEHTWAG